MMKMSGGVLSCCVALLLALTSVSAVQKLYSIDDLKSSLLLLHWFANTVEINTNDVYLNFDLSHGDYGSHYYGNYEELLDPLPWRYRYYTIGNVYTDTSRQFPSYVRNAQEGNSDRIIIRVQEQNGALRRVDQVYITQHYNQDHTYQITTNLLRQIRGFSVSDLINLYGRNTWYNQQSSRLQSNTWYNQQSSRLQSNSTWQTSNRLESRRNDCGDCCAYACCVLLLVVVVVVVLVVSVISSNAHYRK